MSYVVGSLVRIAEKSPGRCFDLYREMTAGDRAAWLASPEANAMNASGEYPNPPRYRYLSPDPEDLFRVVFVAGNIVFLRDGEGGTWRTGAGHLL